MWFHVQQQFDDFPHRPRHLKLGLGLLLGNPAGHEFDLKDEFHILSSIRKTPFICIFFSSFKPSQLFFFFFTLSLSTNAFWTRCTKQFGSVRFVNWYVIWSSETSLQHDRYVLLKCSEWCVKWWKQGQWLRKMSQKRWKRCSKSHTRSLSLK